MNLRKMLSERFSFGDSQHSAGLQLADIVVNAYRRAIVGNLGIAGWKRLGKLLLRFENRAAELIYIPTDPLREGPIMGSVFGERYKHLERDALNIGSSAWAAPWMRKQRGK
jgi:hypothetical protein